MLWKEPEPELPAFVEVAADNPSSVLDPFKKSKSVSEFLKDEEVVCPLSGACCDGHKRFILGILDEAIAGETENQDFKILKTLERFGQKSEEPWYCEVMAAREAVNAVSIHAGLTISSAEEGTHLMWSRGGAAGTGGAANFANFSSSLDGLAADWSAELSIILKAPKVLLLQLYTDSPHRKLSRAFRHPVSGCITTCGHMQQATGANMLRRAHDYLVHMGDLVEKVVGQMSMRLEHVGTYRAGVEGVPASLEPEHFFGMKELRFLLRTRPLVVPFKDTADGSGVMTALRAVTSHYVGKLTGLLSNSKGLGGGVPLSLVRVPG
ncbi:unnamed protein product [Arctogadus glacialis]